MTPDSRQIAEEVPEGEAPQAEVITAEPVPWQERDRADMLDELLRRLSDGETLSSLCRLPEFPSLALVKQWRRADKDLAARFARAREEFWEAQGDMVLDIVDGRVAVAGGVEGRKLAAWGRLQLLDRADAHRKANPNKGKQLPPTIQIVGIEPRKLPAPAPAPEPEEPAEPDNPDGLVL